MATYVTTAAVASQTTGTPIPVNYHGYEPISVLAVATGTLTFSVEYTLDNLFDPLVTPVWQAVSTLSAKTATADGVITNPVRGLRLNVTAWTSGSVYMKVLQGDDST